MEDLDECILDAEHTNGYPASRASMEFKEIRRIKWGLCRVSAPFLESATPSAAISKHEERNHKGANDQSDRTNPPTHPQTPKKPDATTKQH
jgi:hypothetical protein